MNTNLINARKKKKLSQYAVAEKVGCTQTNISQLELGKQRSSLPLAKKLAELLEINVMDVLYPADSGKEQ